ncbi:hypothetical protein [Streptomyces formicae]
MTATQQPTITRQPANSGDELGDATGGGEFHLLIDGEIIGGTYWCPVSNVGLIVEAGKQWASYGPAGYSFGHTTREDAEQAQLDAANAAATVTTVDAPREPQTGPVFATDAYDKALAKAEEVGAKYADEAGKLVGLCEVLPFVVGAVAPRLVWEGAQKKGMTARELCRLANQDPMAVEALMWV